MKKCPYCAELIQNDAVKCRFCNEWLNKPKANTFIDFVSNAKKNVAEKLHDYQEKKTAHLFLPTEERPMIIKTLVVYPDRFQYSDNIYKFERLTIINYNALVSSINFASNRYVTFLIIGTNEKDNKPYRVILTDNFNKSVLGHNFSKKEFEQLSLVYNVMSNASYDRRLSLYINELEQIGFFPYGDYEFYQNGDIKKRGNIVANLKEEMKKGNISFGSAWKGYLSSSDNPFEFSIASGSPRVKILEFETGTKLKIETHVNHDIFVTLIAHFLKNGGYPSMTN